MIKRYIYILLLLVGFSFAFNNAYAAPDLSMFDNHPVGGSALKDLTLNIYDIAKKIHDASSEMMEIGNMVICNSLHGKAAEWKFNVLGLFDLSLGRIIAPNLFLAGIVLYIMGFFVMLVSSYYMFDVAFNLAISITLLPIALSLWLFGWTKNYLKKVIDSISFYTGLFIFLPLGILLAKAIVMAVIEDVIQDNASIRQLFLEDNADKISETFSIFTMSILKIIITYMLAFKIIPTMADEFCKHFFDKNLAGNPLGDKIKQLANKTKEKFKKLGKYGKDVVKHSMGKAIDTSGQGNFMNRSVHRYAQGLMNTQGKR